MHGLSRLLVRAAAGSHLSCFTEAQRACRSQQEGSGCCGIRHARSSQLHPPADSLVRHRADDSKRAPPTPIALPYPAFPAHCLRTSSSRLRF